MQENSCLRKISARKQMNLQVWRRSINSHGKIIYPYKVPGEIKRREVELDLQVSPEEIMSREVELGCKVGLLSLRVVRQQQCNGRCPCDSAQAQQLKQQLRSAQVAEQMARGHRLNTSIVLAAVHDLSGLFRAVSAVEPSLFRPLPILSPSLISHLTSVDVKQQRRRSHSVPWVLKKLLLLYIY